jgi:D-galactarolactone cycloisomerase
VTRRLGRRQLLAAGAAIVTVGCATQGVSRKDAAPGSLLGFADDPAQNFDLRSKFGSALVLDSVQLLQIRPREILLVGRTRDGLEAVIPANTRFGDDIPLFAGRILPHFLGSDARDIEQTIESCFRTHYKLVGLPFWNGVAHLEMLALELLGQATRTSISTLLGGARRDRVSVYLSSRDRTTTPQQEIDEFMAPRIAATGAKACKLGIGGRMSRNADAAPGRSEALVAHARKSLGDGFTICVDTNGSYDAREAIETGRMLESHGVWFYEEPCPFEEFAMTKQVADALRIPVAGGEQDASLPKWRWMIEQRALDIVQPDLFYAGGFLRSLRVARWAETRGLKVVPHAPRAHAASATLLQFAALLDRPGEFHEFSARAATGRSTYAYEPELRVRAGELAIPTGAGFGITYDMQEIRSRSQALQLDIGSVADDD